MSLIQNSGWQWPFRNTYTSSRTPSFVTPRIRLPLPSWTPNPYRLQPAKEFVNTCRGYLVHQPAREFMSTCRGYLVHQPTKEFEYLQKISCTPTCKGNYEYLQRISCSQTTWVITSGSMTTSIGSVVSGSMTTYLQKISCTPACKGIYEYLQRISCTQTTWVITSGSMTTSIGSVVSGSMTTSFGSVVTRFLLYALDLGTCLLTSLPQPLHTWTVSFFFTKTTTACSFFWLQNSWTMSPYHWPTNLSSWASSTIQEMISTAHSLLISKRSAPAEEYKKRYPSCTLRGSPLFPPPSSAPLLLPLLSRTY